MNNNKEIFKKLVTNEKTDTLAKNKARIKARPMLKESRNIALAVLLKLDELGWSQRDLASKMEVTPQYVNKIVKGKENLTLQTLITLQVILEIPLLASFYKNSTQKVIKYFITEKTVSQAYSVQASMVKRNYTNSSEKSIVRKRDYSNSSHKLTAHTQSNHLHIA